MFKRLVILGSGGYGNTVLDIAEQLGYEIVAILDDKYEDHPLSSYREYINDDTEFIVALGNNELRLSWCEKIFNDGGKLAILIHPTAYVSPKTTIGMGSVILPNAVINTGTKVGVGCIVNLGAIIDHDCIVENGVHVCVGAIIKANNVIGKCDKIDAGEIVERSTRRG